MEWKFQLTIQGFKQLFLLRFPIYIFLRLILMRVFAFLINIDAEPLYTDNSYVFGVIFTYLLFSHKFTISTIKWFIYFF